MAVVSFGVRIPRTSRACGSLKNHAQSPSPMDLGRRATKAMSMGTILRARARVSVRARWDNRSSEEAHNRMDNKGAPHIRWTTTHTTIHVGHAQRSEMPLLDDMMRNATLKEGKRVDR